MKSWIYKPQIACGKAIVGAYWREGNYGNSTYGKVKYATHNPQLRKKSCGNIIAENLLWGMKLQKLVCGIELAEISLRNELSGHLSLEVFLTLNLTILGKADLNWFTNSIG